MPRVLLPTKTSRDWSQVGCCSGSVCGLNIFFQVCMIRLVVGASNISFSQVSLISLGFLALSNFWSLTILSKILSSVCSPVDRQVDRFELSLGIPATNILIVSSPLDRLVTFSSLHASGIKSVVRITVS